MELSKLYRETGTHKEDCFNCRWWDCLRGLVSFPEPKGLCRRHMTLTSSRSTCPDFVAIPYELEGN